MNTPNPPAIFLMGATASGKTDLAIALSQHFPLEIVSVDSALIYRGMDIGTAKPGKQTLARYPHHLVDTHDPTESYSAAQFRDDALQLLHDITNRGSIPLLVGGTFLYFRALEYGLSPLPKADANIRERLTNEAEESGWKALHQRLQQLDPESAKKIHHNDPQRLQRALEVIEITGQPLSVLQQQGKTCTLPFKLLKMDTSLIDREYVRQRIALRFEQMMNDGLLDEVRALHQQGNLSPDMPSIRSIGYRQLWAYLEGQGTLDEAIEKAIIASRQYAKRQYTWLRREQNLLPISGQTAPALDLATRYIKPLIKQTNRL